jgi:isoaspartyl peptidase/L-asparaginase-like protein (Ntn-hydrolase superfamily)
LYVDPHVGAAVATGTGELMMGVCATFLAVERMRMGDSPKDAIRAVLERVSKAYKLKTRQQCALITLRMDGKWSSGALVKGFRVAARTDDVNELRDAEFIYQRA